VRRTCLSKLKTHRVVARLAERGIIEVRKPRRKFDVSKSCNLGQAISHAWQAEPSLSEGCYDTVCDPHLGIGVVSLLLNTDRHPQLLVYASNGKSYFA